jgi:ribosomal protein S18 acetylase RimI-like enzyme
MLARLTMTEIERLHRFLHTAAARGREVVRLPPFTAYLDLRDPLRYLNYAIPDGNAEPSEDAVERLREAFCARDRLPRLEWIEEAAPRLVAALAAADFEEELRTPLMVCAPSDLQTAEAAVDDLRIALVEDEAALRAAADIQRISFGNEPLAEDAQPRPASGGLVLALSGSSPVAAAEWTRVVDGISEIVGVATAEPWRRRGLGGAVTAAAARGAFAAGASLCILSPGDEGALRLYSRAGFQRVATMLHWSDPRGSGSAPGL